MPPASLAPAGSSSNSTDQPGATQQTKEQTEQWNGASHSITVSIYDQTYHLRGTNPGQIERLAESVDAKMRAVSAQGNTVDSLRVAVLAALNIADELATLRERYDALAGSMRHSQQSFQTRAGTLAGMLDEVLESPDTRRAG